jgi:hypothetical protein
MFKVHGVTKENTMTSPTQRGLVWLAGACVSLVLSTLAIAKEATLTQDRVARFLAAFPEMRIIAVSEGLRLENEVKGSSSQIVSVMKAIRSTKLKVEAQTVAVKHGFSTLKEWSDTGRAIGQAYVHMTGGSSGLSERKLEKHKDAAVKEIEKLGLLTEKQKQKLKDNLEEAKDELAKAPPPENIAVVKQMQPQIQAALQIPGQ